MDIFVPLQVGDVVELNSGGPAMLVSRVIDTEVEAVWVSRTGEVQKAVFPSACVTRKSINK